MLVDTLKAQRRLVQEYGLDERAAEGIVEVLSEAENQIATKDDFALLRKDFDGLRKDFDGLRTEFDGLRTEFDGLRTEFDGLEERLTVRIDGLREEVGKLDEKIEEEVEGLEEKMNTRREARIRKLEVRLYGAIFAATSLLAALNFFAG